MCKFWVDCTKYFNHHTLQQQPGAYSKHYLWNWRLWEDDGITTRYSTWFRSTDLSNWKLLHIFNFLETKPIHQIEPNIQFIYMSQYYLRQDNVGQVIILVSRYRTCRSRVITFCVITICVRKVITFCVEKLLHFALTLLLHFALVLHFAAIPITFCVNITFCGDYYILRRNIPNR